MRPFFYALRGGLGILLSLACVINASAQVPRLENRLLTQQDQLSAEQQAQVGELYGEAMENALGGSASS